MKRTLRRLLLAASLALLCTPGSGCEAIVESLLEDAFDHGGDWSDRDIRRVERGGQPHHFESRREAVRYRDECDMYESVTGRSGR